MLSFCLRDTGRPPLAALLGPHNVPVVMVNMDCVFLGTGLINVHSEWGVPFTPWPELLVPSGAVGRKTLRSPTRKDTVSAQIPGSDSDIGGLTEMSVD
jgi:hypothetical protein